MSAEVPLLNHCHRLAQFLLESDFQIHLTACYRLLWMLGVALAADVQDVAIFYTELGLKLGKVLHKSLNVRTILSHIIVTLDVSCIALSLGPPHALCVCPSLVSCLMMRIPAPTAHRLQCKWTPRDCRKCRWSSATSEGVSQWVFATRRDHSLSESLVSSE